MTSLTTQIYYFNGIKPLVHRRTGMGWEWGYFLPRHFSANSVIDIHARKLLGLISVTMYVT